MRRIAVVTADVMIGSVDFAAAAGNVPSGRLAVQYTITAHARSVIIHGRLTATRVRPVLRLRDFSTAADLSGLVVTFVATAVVIASVDD